MSKTPRATDKLNVAIATIQAAASMIGHVADEITDANHKRQLTAMLKQIELATSGCYAQLRAIKKAAETI